MYIGHDLYSLLFAFMDEFLFRFSSEGILCCRAEILEFYGGSNSNSSRRSGGYGALSSNTIDNDGSSTKGGTNNVFKIRVRRYGHGWTALSISNNLLYYYY